MCNRCMRSVEEDKYKEDDLSILGTEDGDDNSMLDMNSVDPDNSYRSAVTIKVRCFFSLFYVGISFVTAGYKCLFCVYVIVF